VRPDATPATAWLGRTEGIRFSDGDLFADQASGGVLQFTTEGQPVQSFGSRRGGGPGELQGVDAFDVDGDVVAVLDRANLKAALFGRDAEVRAEFRVAPDYLAIVNLPDGLVGLVPGLDDSAVDVYDRSGELVRTLADASALPLRCARGDTCTAAESRCSGCMAAGLTGGGIAILNSEEAILVVIGPRGQVEARIDFPRDDPLVRGWAEADAPFTEQAQAEANARSGVGERTEILKSYFTWMDAVGDRLILSVVPSATEYRARGYELWVVEPRSGRYDRFGYPERGPGFFATGDGKRLVYAVDPREGSIFAAAVPEGP
jgi:hypothetical protein